MNQYKSNLFLNRQFHKSLQISSVKKYKNLVDNYDIGVSLIFLRISYYRKVIHNALA